MSVHTPLEAEQGAMIQVTADNLQSEVLEASRQRPVLLYIWAERSQSCQQQRDILIKLAGEFQGKFLLASLNVEDADPQVQQLAQSLMMQLGAKSVPTMVLLHQGQPVARPMTGLHQEQELRVILDELTMSPADRVQKQIDQLLEQGQQQQALELLQQILAQEPGNAGLQVLQAKLLLQLGRIDDARQVISALPEDAPGADQPRAKLAFLDMAQDIAPLSDVEAQLRQDADNLEARYQLAVHHVLNDNDEAAYEALLMILARDRGFRDDGARLLMVKMFEQKGSADPLVRRYRNRLFSLMH